MKRKALVVLLAGVTFMSALGVVAALLGIRPASVKTEPAAQMPPTHTKLAPAVIAWSPSPPPPPPAPAPAPKPGGLSHTDGNSWGG